MDDRAYVPAIFSSGWVLERYYNWAVVEHRPTIKLLTKNRGPIKMFLLVCSGETDHRIAEVIRVHHLLGPRSIVAINDFSSKSKEEVRTLAGACFKRVTGRRWLGVGTFIIDLTDSLDTLWDRVASGARRDCRHVERFGVEVELLKHPTPARVSSFTMLYERMARQRGLERPDPMTLQRMFDGDDLLMARCTDSSGRNLVINLVYLCGERGYYLYGVRSDQAPAGAGYYTQWQTMKALKALGFTWYDLGLVGSSESADGIYKFKARLGGKFVDSGAEFQFVPRGLHTAYRMFRAIQTRLRSA
jgi:hypothetical protein